MSCFLENGQPVLKSALLGTSTVWQPQAQSLAPWHEELIQLILVECKVLMRTGHFRLSQFHSFHDFTARENKDRDPRTDVERHFTVVSHQVSLTIQQRVAGSRRSRLSRPKIHEDTIVGEMNNHLPTIYPPFIYPPFTCPSLPSFPARPQAPSMSGHHSGSAAGAAGGASTKTALDFHRLYGGVAWSFNVWKWCATMALRNGGLIIGLYNKFNMMDVFFPPPLLCFPSLFVVIRAVMRWFRWYIWLIAMPSARNLWGMAIEVFPKNSPRSHLVIRFRCRMTIMSFWLLMKGAYIQGHYIFFG